QRNILIFLIDKSVLRLDSRPFLRQTATLHSPSPLHLYEFPAAEFCAVVCLEHVDPLGTKLCVIWDFNRGGPPCCANGVSVFPMCHIDLVCFVTVIFLIFFFVSGELSGMGATPTMIYGHYHCGAADNPSPVFKALSSYFMHFKSAKSMTNGLVKK